MIENRTSKTAEVVTTTVTTTTTTTTVTTTTTTTTVTTTTTTTKPLDKTNGRKNVFNRECYDILDESFGFENEDNVDYTKIIVFPYNTKLINIEGDVFSFKLKDSNGLPIIFKFRKRHDDTPETFMRRVSYSLFKKLNNDLI